jgi:hypothetical protein
MGFVHLAEDRKGVRVLCRCDAVGEYGDDGLAVCVRTGRQPESDGGEIAEVPDGLFGERPAAARQHSPQEASR